MISIQDILKRLNYAVNGIQSIGKTVNDSVYANSQVVLELNKTQLLSGRDTDGKLFSPGYTSDPFFKTPEAAQKYAEWKAKWQSVHDSLIEQKGLYPTKPANIPNLIITGLFQDNMFVNVSNDTYTIDSTYRKSKDIESKYNGLVFGLAPPSRLWLYQYYLRSALLNSLYMGYGV